MRRIASYFLSILLFTSLTVQAQIKTPLRHYSFDNTLIDSTLSGVDLTAMEGAVFDASVKNVGSHSGKLDGWNNHFTMPLSNLGSTFFISLWLRSDGSITDDRVFVTTASPPVSYFYLYATATNVLKAKTTTANNAGNGTWSATAWHNLVYCFRKSDGRCRIYVDGARSAQTDSTVETIFNSNDSLWFGVDYYKNSDWDGNIDEVRIYTGYMPSEAQIDSLYDLSYKTAPEAPVYDPPQYRLKYKGIEYKPTYRGVAYYMRYGIHGAPLISISPGFDSTYVLSCKQKYAIPEDVANGDYAGVWLKTWTWMGNAISYTMETNWNSAFSINASTGLITVSDYTKINGKIVRQDTAINLIIRTTDNLLGYELDTAEVWIKENLYCKFYDFAGAGTGTRANPYNDMDDVAFSTGYGYFLKRGSYINGETTSLTSLTGTEANPTIFAAYGTGNKPFFNGSTLGTGINNRGFVVGSSAGTVQCEYLYFYDIKVRGYYSDAYMIWRPSAYIGLFNCESYNNCQDYSGESSLTYRTSNYVDSSAYAPFYMINYQCDSTQLLYGGPSYNGVAHFKIGCGPAIITNCRFGKSLYDGIRFTCGKGHILRYCLIQTGSASTSGWCSAIQFRGDNGLIEGNRIIGNVNGIQVTSPGSGVGWTYELMPDSLTIRNNFVYGQKGYGIDISPPSVNYYTSSGYIIENNYLKNTTLGIWFRDTKDLIVRRNLIFETNGVYGIQGSGSETSNETSIYYNAISGFLTNGINIPLSTTLTLYNNTVDGSINLSGSTSPTIRNCIYSSIAYNTATVSNNRTINADYFIDYAVKNFMLDVSATDVIDQGYNLSLTPDIIGTTVPQMGTVDIGAYEFIP